MSERITVLTGEINGVFTFDPAPNKPTTDQPSLEELRIQAEYEALQDAYPKDWEFRIPIIDTPKVPTDVFVARPTDVPQALETGDVSVAKERNAFGAISAHEVVNQPKTQLPEEIFSEDMIPVSEDIIPGGLLGIGIIATGVLIANRRQLGELKRDRIIPRIQRIRKSVQLGIADYREEFRHIKDVFKGLR